MFEVPFSALILLIGDRNSIRIVKKTYLTRMWANAQRDGRPSEYRWRRLLNAAKFG